MYYHDRLIRLRSKTKNARKKLRPCLFVFYQGLKMEFIFGVTSQVLAGGFIFYIIEGGLFVNVFCGCLKPGSDSGSRVAQTNEATKVSDRRTSAARIVRTLI